MRQLPYPGAWYNDIEKIRTAVTTLEGLKRLISERYAAHYRRDERLVEFYVLGFLSLDTCGNALKLSNLNAYDFTSLPKVLTRDDFWVEIKKIYGDKYCGLSFSYSGGEIPPPDLQCAHCGKTWSIENCHDTAVHHKEIYIDGKDFSGKTLGEVRLYYACLTDAIYRINSEHFLRNDSFIDLSLAYPDDKSEWARTIVKNKRGWVGEKEGIGNDYVIRPDDTIGINTWKYYHRACNEEMLEQVETSKFKEVFEKAGFQRIEMNPIHNEYCPTPSTCTGCAPWFLVTTEIGTIKIGWRKRVINIDWTEATGKPTKLRKVPKLFKKEGVTLGETYVHCYGWEKAQEYLGRIRETLYK